MVLHLMQVDLYGAPLIAFLFSLCIRMVFFLDIPVDDDIYAFGCHQRMECNLIEFMRLACSCLLTLCSWLWHFCIDCFFVFFLYIYLNSANTTYSFHFSAHYFSISSSCFVFNFVFIAFLFFFFLIFLLSISLMKFLVRPVGGLLQIEGHALASREQFYMMSQKRSNEKPPKLPPRDTSLYSHELPTVSVCFFLLSAFYVLNFNWLLANTTSFFIILSFGFVVVPICRLPSCSLLYFRFRTIRPSAVCLIYFKRVRAYPIATRIVLTIGQVSTSQTENLFLHFDQNQ